MGYPTMRKKALVVITTIMLLLTSCATPQLVADPADYSPAPPGIGTKISRDDLASEKQIPFNSTVDILGDNAVRIYFGSGAENCYGYRSHVKETNSKVKITLYEGRLPDASNTCTMDLGESSMVILTQDPIGERAIVGPQ